MRVRSADSAVVLLISALTVFLIIVNERGAWSSVGDWLYAVSIQGTAIFAGAFLAYWFGMRAYRVQKKTEALDKAISGLVTTGNTIFGTSASVTTEMGALLVKKDKDAIRTLKYSIAVSVVSGVTEAYSQFMQAIAFVDRADAILGPSGVFDAHSRTLGAAEDILTSQDDGNEEDDKARVKALLDSLGDYEKAIKLLVSQLRSQHTSQRSR